MLDTVVHYLTHCSCFELIVLDLLAAITIGLSPFAVHQVLDHALAARRASQGIR